MQQTLIVNRKGSKANKTRRGNAHERSTRRAMRYLQTLVNPDELEAINSIVASRR